MRTTNKYIALICVLAGVIMGVETKIAWQPNSDPQREALRRTEFEVMIGGSRGGGKTMTGLAWSAMPQYISNPKYQGLVIRRNADDLSDWIQRARSFYAPMGGKITGQMPIVRFPSGAIIRTGHLKDENAYEKYQGHEYQKILIEELTHIPTEDQYERLISSCRSTIPELKPGVFSTTNPGNAGHVWVKKRFVDVAYCKPYYPPIGRSRIFIPIRATDNVSLIDNDPGYLDYLNSIHDEKLRRAWVDGDWDVFIGQFFDKWNPNIHVIKPFRINPDWYHIRCLDWGNKAPAAVLWIAVDFEGNHYVYREYKKAGHVPSTLAKTVLSMTGKDEKINGTHADPSIWAKNQYGNSVHPEQRTEKSIASLLEDAGLLCQQANNDRVSGWMNVKELMYWDQNLRPKLFVFENCENFINDIPALVHDDKRVEDCDTDGDDHIADALRYGLFHTLTIQRPAPYKGYYEDLIEKITVDPEYEIVGENKSWDDV